MTDRPTEADEVHSERQPLAGGIFIFLGLLAGIVIGIYSQAITLGVIVGLLVGIAFAVIVWLYDRSRG